MKKVTFKKPVNKKLEHWTERLSRRSIIGRHDRNDIFQGQPLRIIDWLYEHEDAKGKVTILTLTALDVRNSIESDHLMETGYGLICPKCHTNEYIHSQIEWLPIALKEKASRYKDMFGSYCRCCGTITGGK